MSDFDKEAERERLREKYERDEAEREVTQQMSELLLRGATMTNKHCETCSNPIFRYEGEEFCAVCNGQGQEAGEQAQSGADQREQAARAEGQTQATDAGADTTAGTPSVDATDGQQSADAQSPPAEQSPAPDRSAPDRTTAPAAAAGGVGTARESLVATLVDLSERAAAAEDLSRQRALLAAAREAAEAVEATDRLSR